METDNVSGELGNHVLADISAALFQLRRVWAKPELVRKLRQKAPSERPLQLSNLAVVAAAVRMGAEAKGEVTVGRIAEQLDVDPSTASRLIGHAVAAGLMSRHVSAVDARRVHLRPTGIGLRVVDAADRCRRAYLSDLMADWSRHDREQFARLLTRFATAAAKRPLDTSIIEQIFKAADATEPAAPQATRSPPQPTGDRPH